MASWSCYCFFLQPARSAVFAATALFLLLAGCEQNADTLDPIADHAAGVSSCETCHVDYALLKTIASPDTAEAGGGCGGETPHIDPYDRVYMGGDGFEAFKQSSHYKLGCSSCHGGDDSSDDKAVAHGGAFVRHPSEHAELTCNPCHASIAGTFHNSIHRMGWGQKSMVHLRAGVGSFDDLPQQIKDGYETNCAKCHAGCGDCHINRPKAGGGGLLWGHDFQKRPDMQKNCVACHTSRGGHAYFGIGLGTVPDVHLSALGDGHCLSCHDGAELHGDGEVYDQRYKVPSLPSCLTCHASVAASNQFHTAHINDLNCQTCHSQDYNNCGSCHIGGAGARVASYQGFKIGRNPLPQTKVSPVNGQPYTFVTLRRSLMAPDSWQDYGMATLTNFDVRPTYKYTTPHNIKRWTARTQAAAGASCYDNCHIIKEGTAYRNKGLYLFSTDLEAWEQQADQAIIVDGTLPGSWNVP